MGIENTERARRRALLHAHYAAENANDVDRIMKTFAADTVMLYNRQSFADHDGIRQAHGYIGFAGNGAFSGLHNVTDQEHFTDDEIVVEGRLCGKHVCEFGGFAPTDQDVELPFVAFYGDGGILHITDPGYKIFDAAGKVAEQKAGEGGDVGPDLAGIGGLWPVGVVRRRRAAAKHGQAHGRQHPK